LEQEDAIASEIVKLRYFAGLTMEETAAFLQISVSSCKYRWSYARAWLYGRLTRRSDIFEKI
jgi:DNA-directed RNA polymerase specialized sigma24 family protein